MSPEPSAIRLDEWLAELASIKRTTETGPAGFSGEEISVVMGIGHRAAMYHVRNWVRDGRMAFVGMRRSANVTGRVSMVPVYRPVDNRRQVGESADSQSGG